MKNLKMGYGAVRWVSARTPEPKEIDLGVGEPFSAVLDTTEFPAHAEVTYNISYPSFDDQVRDDLSVVLRIPEVSMQMPYKQLELLAAEKLAPFLRDLADAVDEHVEQAKQTKGKSED